MFASVCLIYLVMLCWLGSLPSTGLTLPNPYSSSTRDVKRLHLNHEAADLKEIRAHLDGQPEMTEQGDQVMALVEIEAGQAYSPIGKLDSECLHCQYKYWRQMAGGTIDGHCFFLTILSVVALTSPQPKQNVRRSKFRTFFVSLEDGESERLMACLLEQRVLPDRMSGLSLEDAPDIMLRLPTPFARLASKAIWPSVAVIDFQDYHNLARWSVGWTRPRALQLVALRGQFEPPMFNPISRDELETKNIFEVETVATLGFLLRDAATSLIPLVHHNPPEMKRALSYIHYVSSTLQNHEDEQSCFLYERTSLKSDGTLSTCGVQKAFNISFLINCFWASGLMKSDSNMMELLGHCVRICLPVRLANFCHKLLSGDEVEERKLLLPSASTMSRVRGRLDVAFMLLFQDWLYEALLYTSLHLLVQVDASPQGGRDYEVIVLNIIKDCELLLLFEWIQELESFCHLSVEERIENFDREKESIDKHTRAILCCVPPLVSLGQGRGSLALKFRALLHALALLSKDRPMLARLLAGIVSFHSDYGTEIGLAQIQPIPIQEVLPFWDAPAEAPDVSAAAAVHVEERFDDDLECEVVFDERCHEEDFAAEDDVAAGESAHGEAQLPEHIMADVTGSLEVPGMMHICHNTTNGLKTSLVHFTAMVYKLKKVARLLRIKESKDRVVATCFSSGISAGFAKDIIAFTAEVYWERWQTIADCVRSILVVEVGLRYCWDLSKYLLGTDRHAKVEMLKESGDDEHAAKLTLVDEAIRSDFFWMYMRMLNHIAWLQTRVVRWINSCSCHWDLNLDDFPIYMQKLFLSCPLRGRRCQDMVSGEFFDLISSLFEHRCARLLAEMPPGLVIQERK